MANLLFTPKLAVGGPNLSAEARMASIALHAVISILVCAQADSEGKEATESYAIAFAAMAPHVISLCNTRQACRAVAEIIATADRLGLDVIPELRQKVVIQ